jgi:hypothetical protein
MYKIFKQVEYDEDSRWLVEAVYTDSVNEPRLLAQDGCDTPCYDQDANIRWYRCSIDVLTFDKDDEYKCFELVKHIGCRRIVFDKREEIVLLCTDDEWRKAMKVYGSIEKYIKWLHEEK